MMAVAGATFASLFAAGRTEAAPGQPVLQGRDNQAGTARTSVISHAATSTLRVINNNPTPRDNCAAVEAFGVQNYAVLATGENKSGIWARHNGATTNPSQPAALWADGNQNTGIVATTATAARAALVARQLATAGRYDHDTAIKAEGGQNTAIFATTRNPDKWAIRGRNTNPVSAAGGGVVGVGWTGVAGTATGEGFGLAGFSASGYGLYSDNDAYVRGDLTVTGTINGTGSAETGTVALDADGTATVVPVITHDAGADYDYQLTAIGAAMPDLHLVEHRDGRFRVAGGKPGGAVSWQRTKRTDPAAVRRLHAKADDIRPLLVSD